MNYEISNSKITREIKRVYKLSKLTYNTTTMSNTYKEVEKTCLECKEIIRENQSTIYCEVGQCFWHKKCLKNKIKNEYDDKLEAGYTMAAGKTYKQRRCKCGCLLKKNDRPKRILKKTLKKVIVPVICVLVLL